MDMQEICEQATLFRKKAKSTKEWKLNIEALLESNNALFKGPISYEDMEACFNYVLDRYDPNVLIQQGELKEEDYQMFIEEYDGNPFWSLMEIDEHGNIIDVFLYDTDDREAVAEFLEKKYKWIK